MIKLNLRLIPQAVVKAKATKFVGNSWREVEASAKRKGEKLEPILVESKFGMCVAYYPNDELINLAVSLEKERQAKVSAEAELERQAQLIPLNATFRAFNMKLEKLGIKTNRNSH